MWGNFLFAFNAVGPIVAIIFIGYMIQKQVQFERAVLKSIFKNPMIIGIIAAVSIMALEGIFPGHTFKDDLPFVYEVVKQLSRIATPVALLKWTATPTWPRRSWYGVPCSVSLP